MDFIVGILNFIIGALKVIILLGTLVIIHEFGHFIVAKLCGMKVLKFSIGFGPKILKKQKKETEYSIRALPLGGFVQLEGEEEGSDDPKAFSNKPAWQRLLVLFAGVTINILFALFIYVCINMNINTYITSKLSNVSDSSLVELEGDEIYKINATRVYNGDDVSRIISNAPNDSFKFEVINKDGKKETHFINIPKVETGYIGVAFSDNKVYQVMEDSAGEKAGLLPNDEILSVNGETLNINEYLNIIRANPNKELNLKVKRDNQEIDIVIIPESILKRTFDVDFEVLQDLNFFDNLHYAWNETIYYLRANFTAIGELFRGKTENVELQGIVGISQQISSTHRAIEFFYMMSAISLSLGIMNLLPIPGLDGGKIIFTLIEMIRRKPISKEVEGTLTLAGVGLLILIMIVVTFGDVAKLF